MERQYISKLPCIKSGLDIGCVKCRHPFLVLVKSVVDKGLVLSFVFICRPYWYNLYIYITSTGR